MTPTLLVLAALAAAPVPAADVEELERARIAATEAHLARLGGWAAGNVVAGSALLVVAEAADVPAVRGLALQSAAWGAINLGIIGAASLAPGAPTGDRSQARMDEDFLGKVLWLNLGLDVGYVMAGSTLILGGLVLPRSANTPLGRVDPAMEAASHGLGICVQGAGLFVLDVLALRGHADREAALSE